MIIRAGEEEPEKLYVTYNDKSAYTRSEYDRRVIGNAMRRAERLRIRAFDFRYRPVEAEFHVGDASAMMDRVNLECSRNSK